MKNKTQNIFLFIAFLCFEFLVYKIGYIVRALEKPSKNVIYAENINKETINFSVNETPFNPKERTLLYVSSDVVDKDNETLNRIGIRVLTFTNDKNSFFLEICDSVNQQCIKSDVFTNAEKPVNNYFYE